MASLHDTRLRRVLMTTDTIGGIWPYSLGLCRGLLDEGVEVVLATMGAPLQPRQREEAESLGPGVRLCESNFKLEWMDDPWSDVEAAGRWLLALERAHRPDIVHLNGYAHAALPWSVPVLVVAHSCVFSWWHAVKHAPPPPSWNRYREAVAAGLGKAGLVVAPSRAMLAQLVRHYGPPRRSRVIYNGHDVTEANGRFEAKEPVVLSVGRLWDEAKNAAALAAVAPALPWPVHLAGDTRHPCGEEIRPAGVTLLGHRSTAEIAGDYRRAAIYALPARYEPFGLSVLEAASAGCALVLGDIASLREIWGSAALFVAPDDNEKLQAALAALIADRARREELGKAAREQARFFTAGRMLEAYLAAYAELLRPADIARHPVLVPSLA